MKNIAQAIVNVMKAVDGVEKNTTVGSGNYSYKGVSDKDVKVVYKKAMQENGLSILPIDVQPKVTIERWEAEEYGKTKQKQSIFTEVTTKYLILHTSGESQEIAGYGQGIDSGDKGAGKATTYALKYALLYTFMTPTGSIDDADNTHSEELEKPAKKVVKKDITDAMVMKLIDWAVYNGKTIDDILMYYKGTEEIITKIKKGIEDGKV